MPKPRRMIDLEVGVRELFIEAQQLVFDAIRKHYSIAYAREASQRAEGIKRWDAANRATRKAIKARYRERNRARLAELERARYWRLKAG